MKKLEKLEDYGELIGCEVLGARNRETKDLVTVFGKITGFHLYINKNGVQSVKVHISNIDGYFHLKDIYLL